MFAASVDWRVSCLLVCRHSQLSGVLSVCLYVVWSGVVVLLVCLHVVTFGLAGPFSSKLAAPGTDPWASAQAGPGQVAEQGAWRQGPQAQANAWGNYRAAQGQGRGRGSKVAHVVWDDAPRVRAPSDVVSAPFDVAIVELGPRPCHKPNNTRTTGP